MDLDKLLKTGDACIHSEPPACFASCPLHVDVIAMVTAIQKGDFKKAYQTLEKRVPFVNLIGKICDHPCEAACVRSASGGVIQISELEKSAIEFGAMPPKKTMQLPKKKGKVAIVGGGLSGLVAAHDLDKKGYQVTVFEKRDRIGGRLWRYADKGLKNIEIESELSRLENTSIQFEYNQTVTDDMLPLFFDTYDAVYLGCGEWHAPLEINLETYQVSNDKLFVGGSLYTKSESVIESAASGRHAAISIDRYVTGSSLTASRAREGVFETALTMNMETIRPVVAEAPAGMCYTEAEAVREAGRCLKCQCVECYNACTHLQTFDIFPDDYIRRINHNERIILGTHFANKMINSCTECGLCKVACPVDIDMGAVIHETRESMVKRGKMPISAHDFALKDMAYSNGEHFSLVRRQPSKEQSKSLFYYPMIAFSKYARGLYKGSGKTGYVFYPGCQLSATHADYIEDIYKHLVGSIKEADAERDVGLYLGCCGAPRIGRAGTI